MRTAPDAEVPLGNASPWFRLAVLLVLALPSPGCDAERHETPGDAAPDETAADAPNEAAPDVPAAMPPLAVMSFNLRTAFGDTDQNAWENRVDLCAAAIRETDAWVVGTQEGWKFQLDELAARLPGFAWVGRSRSPDSEWDEYSAILYRDDLFEAVATDTIALSDTPDRIGTKFADAQAYPRILTWALLRHRASGFQVFAFNTHWDYVQSDGIQEDSAALTVRTIATVAGDGPSFLTGDFNGGPAGQPFRILTGAATWEGTRGDLVDAFQELSVPEEGTFHGFTGETTGVRIDWILHGPGHLRAASASVVKYSRDGRWPSDHFPVTAVLEAIPGPGATADGG